MKKYLHMKETVKLSQLKNEMVNLYEYIKHVLKFDFFFFHFDTNICRKFVCLTRILDNSKCLLKTNFYQKIKIFFGYGKKIFVI